MPLDPKTLIPDVHAALAALANVQMMGPTRTQAAELERATDTLKFIGAALGDAALLREVTAWRLPENAASGLEGLLAGRDLVRAVNTIAAGRDALAGRAPISPEGTVRCPDGVLRFADDPTTRAQFHVVDDGGAALRAAIAAQAEPRLAAADRLEESWFL